MTERERILQELATVKAQIAAIDERNTEPMDIDFYNTDAPVPSSDIYQRSSNSYRHCGVCHSIFDPVSELPTGLTHGTTEDGLRYAGGRNGTTLRFVYRDAGWNRVVAPSDSDYNSFASHKDTGIRSQACYWETVEQERATGFETFWKDLPSVCHPDELK